MSAVDTPNEEYSSLLAILFLDSSNQERLENAGGLYAEISQFNSTIRSLWPMDDGSFRL